MWLTGNLMMFGRGFSLYMSIVVSVLQDLKAFFSKYIMYINICIHGYLLVPETKNVLTDVQVVEFKKKIELKYIISEI